MLAHRVRTKFQPNNPEAVHARFERIKKRALEAAERAATPTKPLAPARSWRAAAAAKRTRIAAESAPPSRQATGTAARSRSASR
jgi:hypothetical protein